MNVCLVSATTGRDADHELTRFTLDAAAAWHAAGHRVTLVSHAPDPARRAALAAEPALATVRCVSEVSADGKRYQFALARHAAWFSTLACAAVRAARPEFDYIECEDNGAAGYDLALEQHLFGCFGDAVVAVRCHVGTLQRWRRDRRAHAMPPTVREVCVMERHATRRADLVVATGRDRSPSVLPALRFGPAQTRPARDQDGPLRLVFAGPLTPSAGAFALVEACAALPEGAAHLELLGEDRQAAPLAASSAAWLRRRLPPHATLAELPRGDALTARLRQADLCVLPESTPGCSLLTAVAMAQGVPVLGVEGGGAAALVEPGATGFLAADASADELRRCLLEQVLPARSQLAALGARAAERVRAQTAGDRYVAAMQREIEAVRGRRGARPVPSAPAGKVSIVVPYYKESPEILRAAVDSALAQTHDDLEILIVDDGSPRPDAGDTLAALAARDPRIAVHRKPNEGLAATRNRALELVAGDFVLWLDADNLLRPEYARTGLEVFAAHDDIAAVTPHYQIFHERIERRHVVVNPLPFDRALSLFRNDCGDAGSMFRRAVFAEHGLRYDPAVDSYSDWALWMDMAAHGLQVQPIPRILFDYRTHQGSMTNAHKWDHHLELLGLLIERHLPPSRDDTDERALLTTLAQGWGVGAILGAWGGKPEFYEEPVRMAQDLGSLRMRHRLADALARAAHRVPGLAPVLSATANQGFRLHGRYKDWRRGNRPV